MLRRCATIFNKTLQPLSYYEEKQSKGIGRTIHVFMDRGEGSYVYDTQGKKFLDFTCGIGVTSLGHCHPRLVKVVQNQAGKLWHAQVSLGAHRALAELIHEMDTVIPKPLDNYYFANSGTEAIEGAMRAARAHTKKSHIIAIQGAYHGRTSGAQAISSSKYAYAMYCRPQQPGVSIAPAPYTTQMKLDPSADVSEMTRRCLLMLDDVANQQIHPSEIAMLIVEPILGEGGYIPLPAAYLQGLRTFCDQHHIILALDEVQSGFGRTGTMFSCNQSNITPDLLVFAKGIANGLPLAGFATTKAIGDSSYPGTQGGTYTANALACASAVEVIKIFREEKILDNCLARGKQLWKGVESIIQRNNLPMQEVRGRGLMIGCQFNDNVPSGTAVKVAQRCLESGLLLINTSKFETLRLIPPLNVSQEEAQEGLLIFESALKDVVGGLALNVSGRTVTGFKNCCETPCYLLPKDAPGADLTCRRITQFSA